MKLVDANLLLYAYDRESRYHEPARRWFEEAMSDVEPIGFAVATVVAFVRITTSARILKAPMSLAEACDVVESWMAHPGTFLVLPTKEHWTTFKDQAIDAQASGALAADAHIAACAREHGATLYTHDRDFTRFRGIRVEYPLHA